MSEADGADAVNAVNAASSPGVRLRPRAERARQVADVLRQRITADAFAGGVLPDERVLGQSLGAGRNVVREALGLLRDEGLITRHRGIGTRVTAPKLGHGLDRLTGLAETLTAYGTVTNQVRAAHVVPHAPKDVTLRLCLPEGSEAVCLERLRSLDGTPLSVDTSWLTPDVGRPLLDRDLIHRDVFDLIEEVTGTPLGSADVTVHAVAADRDTARLLGIGEGAVLFAIERLTRLADGRPVDAETLRVRADRMMLRTRLHRGPSSPNP
ncbi:MULTISPECIES: GntR family transcriptional regulator [unclassified Streptomyces]|uniref:GntR family transcriptional regulator n=1 Tax=unclassified Streptomyces TaxID=2593676 RepID=UPI000996759E|nr:MULTISPECIES: GntR family transcriptional regulator [unclassified Streptomyces]MYY01708.1 UTRA domain-containing protein [Streptomyces sp. SID4913]